MVVTEKGAAKTTSWEGGLLSTLRVQCPLALTTSSSSMNAVRRCACRPCVESTSSPVLF